jgi:hypothetical protein
MVWENTSEGTAKMFEDENEARFRFCERWEDEMVECCNMPMSVEDKKSLRKKLASKYYKKD